jgi:N-acetylneuraminic acid mutarotase
MINENRILKILTRSLLSLALLANCSTKNGGTLAVPEMGVYTELAYMLQARAAHAMEVVNGKIYVFGGMQSGPTLLATVEEYDPATDTWTNKALMPAARFGMGSAVFNNKVYLFGGYRTAVNDSNTVYEYDPAIDTWTVLTAMTSNYGYTYAATVGSYIYFFAGTVGGVAQTARARRYDPATDTWLALSSFAGQTIHGRHIVVDGTNIYFVGRDPIIIYDTVTDTWSTNANSSSLSTMNGGKNAVVLNNKIYTFDASTGYSSAAEIFDIATLTSSTGYLNTLVISQGAAVTLGGEAYVTGGSQSGSVITNKLHKFVP